MSRDAAACIINPLETILTSPCSCSFPEGELEAEWLQDVGLSTLVSGNEEEDGKALLSTLTRTQAAAVKKRYNTYTQTLRKKNKQPVRDVRDVFGVSESPVCNKCGSEKFALISGWEGVAEMGKPHRQGWSTLTLRGSQSQEYGCILQTGLE